MYRILLADDEGIVIESMKFIIDKEFGQECIVEYAKTGRSVIELAESFRPDIAVMDIQMPGINGIDAMKEIRKTNQKVIFIVMSAFDKFDYAKEAIKLGVSDYITKPMEKNKIIAALKKAMESIDGDREKRSNDLIIKEKLETVIPIIETGMIYNIMFHEHFIEDIQSYKDILGITQNYAYMISVVCGEAQEGNHLTNAVGSSVRLQKYYQEIRNMLKSYFPCIVGTVISNKIAVVVPYEHEKMEYNERIELIDKARELVRNLKKRTENSFRIGISGVKELGELRESYNEALHALVNTTSSVAHADDLPIRCEYGGNYPIHLEKRIFARVETGELEEAIEAGNEFFDWMVDNNPDNMMDIRLKSLEFVLWSERIAYESGGMTYQLDARQDYLPTVMSINDFNTLKKWFLDKISVACQNIMHKKSERSTSIIESAKEYIRLNYNKDISLDEISRRVNISPYYFSKIFKDDTKEGFVEYLTNVRIEKAKELLLESDYSMKEICSMVGYADPNYFSRSFKKNVGVTPTEYREGKEAI